MRPRPGSTGRQLATSPFIRAVPVVPTTADFSVGDLVTLDSRGMGRVVQVTDEYVVVDFKTGSPVFVLPATTGFSRL